ncbi:hypothetical protein FB451DRAFT_1181410 [Mycena latifolia]|nr:hypothetical protein FB451DRAFT_1181410 [Mycena latifolia]
MCAGANIWGPVILDGGRGGAPHQTWCHSGLSSRAVALDGRGAHEDTVLWSQGIGEDGERLHWIVVRPFREGKKPDWDVGMSAGCLAPSHRRGIMVDGALGATPELAQLRRVSVSHGTLSQVYVGLTQPCFIEWWFKQGLTRLTHLPLVAI